MPRAVSLVDPSGLGHVAAEVALQLSTVQTQVGRFAHADVLPRRSFFKENCGATDAAGYWRRGENPET